MGGARDSAAPSDEARAPYGAAGQRQARTPEGALSAQHRIRIRDEEHQALRGVLPSDLMARAVRLNVASRERGGGRVVTVARVGQLGVEGIRKVLAVADPKQAALAIARALVSRVRDRGAERER